MPQAPKTHRNPGHADSRRQADQRRLSASERGYNWRWTKYLKTRLAVLVADSADPLCRYCGKRDAETLDHVLPPTRFNAVGSAGYQAMFNDERLFVPCCLRCNSDKQDKLPHELTGRMQERVRAILQERGIGY